jgi:acyltransferase
MNTGKRILWIDYAKSICIYLVLLGHAHASQPVTDFIYTFHMPLFFFLSGCLFSFEKHPNFKEFAIKRFKGLMVPYLWINLITYLFWLFAGRNFGEDATISTTWYSPIIGILLGYSKQMIHIHLCGFSFVSISWKYFTTSYSNRYKRKANR